MVFTIKLVFSEGHTYPKVLKLSKLHNTAMTCYISCHNNPKFWDRQAGANSVDSDQMLLNAVSDQSPHCLPLIQQFF